MKSLKLLFVVYALVSPDVAFCQNNPKDDIQAAVHSIAALIEKNYVFAEKGKTIATEFLNAYRKGYFKTVNNWKTLESAASEWLQRNAGDGHLYLRNDPKTVKELMANQSRAQDTMKEKSTAPDPFYFSEEAAVKNFGFTEVKILAGNIGYLKVTEINISARSLPVLYAAMSFISNTNALIIDLRDNGGGGSDVGAVFESFFLPPGTPLLEFKSRTGLTIKEQTVSWLTEKTYDKPLYILVNKGTASAAEAFAYTLQHQKRAVIIGQRSAGGANMNSWFVVNDELFVSVSTAAPTLPGTTQSWEQKGITPDHVVENGKEIEWILQSLRAARK